jgi:formylglycine-generating enzyme required for sulfatase activity
MGDSPTNSGSSLPYIFISYQRDSEEEARALNDYLTQQGFRVWQDVDNIRHTDRWAVAINSALQECERIIVLLTPASMQSQEVFNEWWSFYEDRKPIHTLMLETCKPFYSLRPFQYLDWRNPKTRPWSRLAEALQAPFTWPALASKENAILANFAPRRTVPEALTKLKQSLLEANGVLALHPVDHQAILEYSPANVETWYLIRYATWCGEKYQLDERFVRLSMLLDQGPTAQQRWLIQGHVGSKRFDDLRTVLDEETSPVIVLLGDPGAGKSTLLRRLEMDIAVESLRNTRAHRLPFYVSLAEYGVGLPDDKLPTPYDWLMGIWSRQAGNLPSFDEILQNRRFLFLFDSLNEIPHVDRAHFEARAALWRDFLHRYVRDLPGNRALFACRTLDYGSVLSSEALTIPQLQLERMTREQVRDYLENYAPEHADRIWEHLEADERQFDLFSIPFMLQMLIDRVLLDGKIPQGRAETFTGFVRGLLDREVRERRNPLVRSLLTAREVRRILNQELPLTPYALPERGRLIPDLSLLAFAMQDRKQGEDKGQVVIDYDDALELLPGNGHRENLLKAACDLTVLEERQDQIRYFHQLLQEFFAARRLAKAPNPALVAVPWHKDELKPTLDEVLTQISDSDPLPGPPTTGWEETTVLAVPMTAGPEAYIRQLMVVNLPLAARCATTPEVTIRPTLKAELQQALIARTQNPEADLRARIAAGLALGNLGDPRFERKTGPYGEYLLPPLVEIEAGTYPIGSEDGYDLEKPPHMVTLAAFAIGKFPVTNAEYALFIKAGGYEDERWWDTDEARAWLRGEGTNEGIKQRYLELWQALQNNPNLPHQLYTEARISSENRDQWLEIGQMSREHLKSQLDAAFQEGEIYREPRFWRNANFNNPAQPVVGICWFEARAYFHWLSAQTGLKFRLPTEVEWEAAARGKTGRRFAWGENSSPALCNSFETHIRRTTPIGVFPGGETPGTGLVDMTGNIWEWCSTIFDQEHYPYPYVPDDGREIGSGNSPRVWRGGSWSNGTSSVRAAVRNRSSPGDSNLNAGVRGALSIS